MSNNYAFLKPESPFFDLFPPNGWVPIVNIIVPNRAELEGHGEVDVYMVDKDKVDMATLNEIARRLAVKAGEHPAIVFGEIMQKGLPLRVSETTGCSSDAPWFL